MILKLPSTRISQLFTTFTRVYFLVIIIAFLWFSYKVISFPFGVDYGEAPLFDQAMRIQHHEALYKADFNSPPYVISNYPPLFTMLIAGINSAIHTPLFQTGRFVSLIFAILSGTLIGLFGFYLTNNKILGMVSASIFLGNPYVILWSAIARVDMMALGLSLLGLFILYRRKYSTVWIVIASLCLLASAFTRQTYLLAGPMAGIIWLFHHDHRKGFLFILSMGLTGLVLFGTINAMTQGGFYSNLVIANVNQFHFSRAVSMLGQLSILWPIILPACVAALIMTVVDWNITKKNLIKPDKETDFLLFGLGLYTLGAIIIAFTAGKVGSNINYFLELIAVCAIWIAIACSYVLKARNIGITLLLVLFVLQMIWVLVGMFSINSRFVESQWDHLSLRESLYQRINQSTKEGIVLSDDYQDLVVMSGQPIYYQPFEYGQLYQAGLWDAGLLASDIQQQKFPLIVIGGVSADKECCWPPPLAEAINQNYHLELEPGIGLFTPKR